MGKWFTHWDNYFSDVKQNWSFMNEAEKKFHLQQLASSQQTFLDYFAEVDEFLLDQLCDDHSVVNDDYLSYESKGTSYYKLNMFNRAIIELETERKLLNDHPTLLLFLGYSYLYEKYYEKAKEIFLYLLHTSKMAYSEHFSYCGLGLVAFHTKQIDEAIEFFEKALTLTMNIDVVYNLGMCHYLLKRPHIAAPFFQEVITKEHDPFSFYYLGKCYLQIENKEKAFETWLSSLQTVESYQLLHTLAYEFEELGHSTAAIHCYDRLQLLGFQDVSIRHGIAWNYGLLDIRNLSIRLFESLLNDYPEHVNSWISFLWLLRVWDEVELFHHYYDLSKKNGITHPLIEKVVHL